MGNLRGAREGDTSEASRLSTRLRPLAIFKVADSIFGQFPSISLLERTQQHSNAQLPPLASARVYGPPLRPNDLAAIGPIGGETLSESAVNCPPRYFPVADPVFADLPVSAAAHCTKIAQTTYG